MAITNAAFKTHHNYVSNLEMISRGLRASTPLRLRKQLIPDVDTKLNLIDLTRKSLNDELDIVNADPDYSYASTSWLPVKTYYLIFNMLVTIEYLYTIDKKSFKKSHTGIISTFNKRLLSKEISFSNPLFNQVFDSSILGYTSPIGANISKKTSDADLYKMAIRKVAIYKFEDWKAKRNLRSASGKIEKTLYLKTFTVTIFDFFYYMRIRSNYRDFAFIENVTEDETADYFRKYFYFSANVFNSLKLLKNELKIMRTV